MSSRLDPAKAHLVVHIVDREIPYDLRRLVMPYGDVEYRQWVVRGDDARLRGWLGELLAEVGGCETNALIVCSSAVTDVSDAMNHALADHLKDKSLKNLKIIHEMSADSDRAVVLPHADAVRNVVNVYPLVEDERPVVSWGFKYAYTARDFPIQESWWWTMHFSVPPCANGRALQNDHGTCWFNTALNIVLLSPELSAAAKVATEQYRAAEAAKARARTRTRATTGARATVADGAACVDPHNPPAVKKMLFEITNNLFFKGRRLRRSQGASPILSMAGRVKHGDAAGALPNVNYGEAGKAGDGLQALVYALSAVSLSVDLPDGCPASDVLGLPAVAGRTPPIIIAKFPSYLSDRDAVSRVCARLLDDYGDQGDEYQGNGYALDAALIRLTHPFDPEGQPSHAVAGLLCNDKPYVYDSNDFIAQADWPNGDLRAYSDELSAAGVAYANFDAFVEAAVYVDTRATRTGKFGGLAARPALNRRRDS